MRDGDDSILVALLKQGEAHQTQHGWHRVEQGDGIVCDCAYAGELNFTTDTQFWDVRIPRRKLAALLPPTFHFAGKKLDANPTARRLLFAYLGGVFGTDVGAAPRTAELCGDHIVDLIALALGADGEAGRSAQAGGGRAARLRAVLRTIERRSGDPGLSASVIAAVHGVTPRYVHLLLEETGKSFTHHVLERRLQTAAALLRDPRWRERRIAEIATEVGFTDLSYFSRAFRRHYGATPSDARQSAIGEDAPLS
jgi:AraC-like DNA-binding protein